MFHFLFHLILDDGTIWGVCFILKSDYGRPNMILSAKRFASWSTFCENRFCKNRINQRANVETVEFL
jgi:hypothetical protein